MTSAKHQVETSFLRSKVARRIFLLFILCALLPLGAIALFSFTQVRTHLNDLSQRRLHQASKAAGMTIIERLAFLESDLQPVIADLSAKGDDVTDAASLTLGKRMGGRFRNLVLVSKDKQIVSAALGVAAIHPKLTADESGFLRSGGTLVTTASDANGRFSTFIARILEPANPRSRILLGEINPEYLWGGDGFLSPATELCVFGQNGELLFSTLPEGIPWKKLDESVRRDGPSGRFEWSIGKNSYVASYWTLFMRPQFYNSWIIVQSENQDEVLEPLRKFTIMFVLVVLLTFLVVTYLSLKQIHRNMIPIELLRNATQRIKAKDFTHRVKIESNDEFEELGDSFNEMTESMENHVSVMNAMNRIGVSLSAERDEKRLLEIILRGAQAAFNADGAALFLLSPEDQLELSMLHISSLGLWEHGSPRKNVPELQESQELDVGAMWASTGATRKTIMAPDVYAATDPDFIPLIEFDRKIGYRSKSFLSVPLRNHENEVIGILQLINVQAKASGQIIPFSAEDRRLAESLSSQAAVALTKNRLVQDFRGLFEGLTELISKAIDEKSPYTGGHVRRVVVLTMMLAEAVCKSTNSALKDFVLSEDELYELRIAALLHDCGKITTPVHIADKARKLETIYDRIDLVETRSEIIRRDHKITLLEQTVRGLAERTDEYLLSRIERNTSDFARQLEQDLAFLRQCNNGTEFMPETQRARVREIFEKYAWVNARRERVSLLTEDEVHHLSVPSGTLTAEERNIINNHVVSTIRMLEALPYPKKLRNIPLYAGTHHERMDGAGYPKKLDRAQIPLQGRIIGIADIFEALTAKDRPYKRANSLAEALRILEKMAQSGHIDPDLYDLFMSEKIHLRYAREYLDEHKSCEAESDTAWPEGVRTASA